MTTDQSAPANRPLIRGVVVAGLALVAAGGMLALNFGAHKNTESWERTFPAVDNVRVVGNARVRVETWKQDHMSVALDADWYGHRSPPKATVDGDTLVARACDGSFWHNFYWHAYCHADFVIRVPEGTSLTTHSDNRTTTATGTFAALDMRSDSGRIEATDITAPRVSLRTDSGSVALSGSTPSADVRTDSGSIRIDAETTSVNARTDSGSVTADLRGDVTRVAAKTDSGSVSVTVPLTGYRVTTSTDSGRRNIDDRLTNGTSARSIDLSTDSGSITLQASETP